VKHKTLIAMASTVILVAVGAAVKRYIDQKIDEGEWQ
jgi:hypothetical protein